MQIEALQDQKRQATPRDLSTDPALAAALNDVTPQLLIEAVDELLLVQYGRELGVKFTDDNFKLALENVKKQNKLDDAQLQVAMKEAGLTLEQLRKNFERTWIRQEVERREVGRNLQLTDEEARQYYRAHPDQFMSPPTITLREILIAVPTETVGGQPTVNVARDEAAKEKISALRERAVKGEDFVKLVEEASEAGTKANGGLIGPVLIADLASSVAATLEKLEPGQLSEVVRVGNGYKIFKLETRTKAEVEPFDKVRDRIANRIYNERLETEVAKFLKTLRSQAVIEWKDESYRLLYEKGQAARAKTG
jgi:peptidyl-prolyl cis-trans isomerase SurA